jgi:hypothetical protein
MKVKIGRIRLEKAPDIERSRDVASMPQEVKMTVDLDLKDLEQLIAADGAVEGFIDIFAELQKTIKPKKVFPPVSYRFTEAYGLPKGVIELSPETTAELGWENGTQLRVLIDGSARTYFMRPARENDPHGESGYKFVKKANGGGYVQLKYPAEGFFRNEEVSAKKYKIEKGMIAFTLDSPAIESFAE